MFVVISSSLSAATFGLFTYEIVDGTSIEITDYPTTATGDIVIPATIEGKSVTSIGYQAFLLCTSLTSVTIPSSVTSIGDETFYDCSSLTSVTLPSGVTSIGYRAFKNCISLTSVTIPSGVTSIGFAAFSYCRSLTSVTIPSGVTSIGAGTFSECRSLTSVTIPSGVTSIGDQVFVDCSSLTSVTIPSGVTSIGDVAFYGCISLTSVTIPSSVTSFGVGTFYGCSSLRSTYFAGNAPALFGANVFDGVTAGHIIYYLDSSTGFASPLWNGYATQEIDTSIYPAAQWLLDSNHSYDTAINQDLNGDGVDLLMAYALNLNPNERLTDSLPKTELDSTTLSLNYYADSTGVTYKVESSKDLNTWETTDVTTSDPNTDGVVTASIVRDEVCGFLRLVVIEE